MEHSNDRYYIHGPGGTDGGGVLAGVVLELGWSSAHIVAKRYANFRGDPDGWMVIDLRTKIVAGPISEDELKNNPNYKTIKIYPPKEALSML